METLSSKPVQMMKPKINIRESRSVKQSIDLTNLPRIKNGNIDWEKSVGFDVPYQYNEEQGNISIIDIGRSNDGKRNILLLKHNDYTKWCETGTLTRPNLGAIIGKIHLDYIYNIGDEIKTSKNKLMVLQRETRERGKRFYYLECLKCHTKRWVSQQSILRYKNATFCEYCNGHKCLTGYNDITITDPWMIPYFQGGYDEAKQYLASSGKKKIFICPDCGRLCDHYKTINSLYVNRGFQCICNNSWTFPERFVASVLDQNGIKFIREYSPKWIGKKRYDFYLQDYNCIIEADGEWGHGFYQPWKSYEQSEKEFEDDEYKNKMASEHGIYLFRLTYIYEYQNEFDKEVQNELPNIFWEKTDWAKAYDDAHTNRKKKVCELYVNSDKSKEAKLEICEKMHCSPSTLKSYIKIGEKLGWI